MVASTVGSTSSSSMSFLGASSADMGRREGRTPFSPCCLFFLQKHCCRSPEASFQYEKVESHQIFPPPRVRPPQAFSPLFLPLQAPLSTPGTVPLPLERRRCRRPIRDAPTATMSSTTLRAEKRWGEASARATDAARGPATCVLARQRGTPLRQPIPQGPTPAGSRGVENATP